MLVLGNTLKSRFLSPLWISFTLLCLLFSLTLHADAGLIALRKGPGSAFPVVIEIPADHSFFASRRQAGWVLLTDGRRSGWVRQQDLSVSRFINRSQLWLIRDSDESSSWRFQVGLDSQQALQLAGIFSWRQHQWALRGYRSSSGDSAWQSLEVAAATGITQFKRSQLLLGLSLGYGRSEAGETRWNDAAAAQTTALGGVTLDWQLPVNQQLEFVLRLKNEQAFAGNEANDSSVALMWNLKL